MSALSVLVRRLSPLERGVFGLAAREHWSIDRIAKETGRSKREVANVLGTVLIDLAQMERR